MKNILFLAIAITLCLNGCQEHGRYIPVESNSYNVKDKEIIYETDSLKLIISCQFLRMSEEQYTEVEIVMGTNIPDIKADFGKMELEPDRQVHKNYISSVDGEGLNDKKEWILKKGKRYHFYIYFTTEYSLSQATGAYIKNIGFNMSKIFQHNNKSVPIPEIYFASDN